MDLAQLLYTYRTLVTDEKSRWFLFLTKLTPLMAVEKVAFTPTVHDLCLPLLAVKSNNRKAFNTWFKHTEPTQTAQANQSLQLIYEENKTKHKTKQSLVTSAPAQNYWQRFLFRTWFGPFTVLHLWLTSSAWCEFVWQRYRAASCRFKHVMQQEHKKKQRKKHKNKSTIFWKAF